MTKLNRLSIILIMWMLATHLGGGYFATPLRAETTLEEIPIDLTDCYIFEVNPEQVQNVRFSSLATLEEYRQHYDISPTRRIYYFKNLSSYSESNKRFFITLYFKSGYGFKRAYYADGPTYTNAIPIDGAKESYNIYNILRRNEIFIIEADLMTNIRTGTLTQIYDHPSNIGIKKISEIGITSGVSTNSRVIYSPTRESNSYCVYRNDGRNIGSIKLDGVEIYGPSVGSTPSSRVDLKLEDGNHTLEVVRSWDKFDIPVKFEYENLGGNQPIGELSADFIESVTVAGVEYTNKEWLADGFSVPNDTYVKVKLSPQFLKKQYNDSEGLQHIDYWVPTGMTYYGNYLNDSEAQARKERTLGTSSGSLYIDQYNDDPFVIKIKGWYDDFWYRFRVKSEGLARQIQYTGHIYTSSSYIPTYSFTGSNRIGYIANEAVLEAGYGAASTLTRERYGLLNLRCYPIQAVATETGADYKQVDKIVVDGDTIGRGAWDNGVYLKDEFKITKQDATIIPILGDHRREIPVRVYFDHNNSTVSTQRTAEIRLDCGGLTEAYYIINPGWNTIYVKEDDFPLRIASDESKVNNLNVYVNGSLDKLTKVDSRGRYSELKELAPNSELKIFRLEPKIFTNTFEIEEGLECEIYRDEVLIEQGTLRTMEGSEVRFVPALKSDLVVSTSDGRTITPDADGNFTITPTDRPTTYTLRCRDQELTVDSNDHFNVTFQIDGSYPDLITGPTQKFTLPAIFGTDATFSGYVRSQSGYYEVTSVTATPSAGFTFDRTTGRVTGLKDGMTLKVVTKRIEKPLGYNINIDPGENESLLGQETGLALKYTMSGMNRLTALKYGENKGTLTQDAYPVSIGPYTYSRTEFDENGPKVTFQQLSQDLKVTVNGKTTRFKYFTDYSDSNDPSITVSTPEAVEGHGLIDRDSRWLTFKRGVYAPEFTYTVGYGEEETGQYDTSFEILPTEKLTVKLKDEDPNAWNVYLAHSDYRQGETIDATLTANFDGEFVLETTYDSFQNLIYEYGAEIKFRKKTIALTANIIKPTESEEFNPTTQINGDGYMYRDMMGVYDVIEADIEYQDEVTITAKNPSFRLIDVYDDNHKLSYDRETGVLSGISSLLALQDGGTPSVTVNIEYIPYERDRSLYVKRDNTTLTSSKMTLASGKAEETTETLLDGAVIKFNPDDLPMIANIQGGTVTRPVYPTVYLNGELVEHNSEQYVLTGVNDGDVLRINGSESTSAITYVIEDGMAVSIMHDGRAAVVSSEPMTVPAGTVVTVMPDGGDLSLIEIVRNGAVLPAAGKEKGFSVSEAEENIVIRKARYRLAVAVTGGIGVDELEIFDSAGNKYELEPGAAEAIEAPVDATTIYMMSTNGDYYISGATAEPGSMKFDVNTGVLTDACEGSVTLSVKKITRDREATFYLHEEELAGSSVILGRGKVFETSETLMQGEQIVAYGEDDLPLILRIPDLSEDSETGMKTDAYVLVNGKECTFDATAGGYVMPEKTFDGTTAPVIRIYSSRPEPVMITYEVENGIEFKAVADGNPEMSVTQSGPAGYLPGTNVRITATPAGDGPIVFTDEYDERTYYEEDGVDYTFTVEDFSRKFSLRHMTTKVTLSCDGNWECVRVVDGGTTLAMTGAVTELDLPMGTTELTLRSASESLRISRVLNAETGEDMTFDINTGEVKGIYYNIRLSVEVSTYDRDKDLTVYVDEDLAGTGEDIRLVLSSGKAMAKEIKLQGGYQSIAYNDEDLPLAVVDENRTESPLAVYLNDVMVDYGSDGYEFDEELPEGSVVKVYAGEQQTVKVTYDFSSASGLSVAVTHDMKQTISNPATHYVLPGTEIRLAVSAAPSPRSRAALSAADQPYFIVTANSSQIEPQDDGTYVVKALRDHVDGGLNIKVEPPVPTGIDEIMGEGVRADVYNLKGVLILRDATREEIRRLAPGVYIANGVKIAVR